MNQQTQVDFGEMGARIQAGSKLSGTLTFPAGRIETPSAFVQWSTKGRGDRDQGAKIPVTLKTAPRSLRGIMVGGAGPESSAASAHLMWFEADIPYEPLSYEGRIVSICWHLVIRYQSGGQPKSEEFEFRVQRPE